MEEMMLVELISIQYPAKVFSSLSASCCSVLFAASQKTDVVTKPQVAKRSYLPMNVLLLSFEKNFGHFYLVTLHWSRDLMTSIGRLPMFYPYF